jgi:hypothetical protein
MDKVEHGAWDVRTVAELYRPTNHLGAGYIVGLLSLIFFIRVRYPLLHTLFFFPFVPSLRSYTLSSELLESLSSKMGCGICYIKNTKRRRSFTTLGSFKKSVFGGLK